MNSSIQTNKELQDININLWITANAGSGKTTQLVNRYLLLLANNIKPEEIMCITYTEAGAEEMKNRISQKAKENGFNIKKHQLKISTIHSFCKQILTENNLLSPEIGILNNNQYTLDKIVRQIINSFHTDETKETQLVQEMIKNIANSESLYSFHQTIKDIIKNQLKFFSLFSLIYDSQNYSTNLLNRIDVNNIYKLLPKQLQQFIGNKQNIHKKGEKLQEELKKQDAGQLYAIAEKIVGTTGKKSLENFINKNGEINKDEFLKLKNWKEIVLTTQNEPRKSLTKYASDLIKQIAEYYAEGLLQIGIDATYSMLYFAYAVLKKYQQIKIEMNVNTYDDLLFHTSQALKYNQLFSNEKNNIGSNIKHLMLDEAQDTNPISWQIIEQIIQKTGCHFFVVGDKKQSIYRFQGAKIEEYEKHKRVFENLSNSFGTCFNQNVKLNTSFRSIKPILEEVDKLCNNPENKNAFTIYENEIIEHNVCEEKLKQQPSGYILDDNEAVCVEQFKTQELENINCANQNENPSESQWFARTNTLLQKQNEKQKKTHEIAEKIYKYILKHNQDIENGIIRDEQSNGIAIIYSKGTTQGNLVFDLITEMRSCYNLNITMKASLEKYNINFLDLVSVIKFYILQNDNMNLACLLKSKIFNFTDQDLKEICKNCDNFSINNTLWKTLKTQIIPDENINKKITFAVNVLKEIIDCKTLTDVILTMQKLIENQCKINEECKNYLYPLAIIQSIIKQSQSQYEYDARSFLLFLQDSDFNNIEIDFSNNTNTKQNNCYKPKILFSTIHGVKGMEFDEVILLELKQKNNSNKEKMMFFDNCFWYKASGCKIQTNNIHCLDLLKNIKQQEQQDKNEELRLKYVAITRAKRRFILFQEI